MAIEPGRLSIFRPLPEVRPPAAPLAPAVDGPQSGQSPFLTRLTEAVRDVDTLQHSADTAAQNLATGRADNVQDVVVAMEKADLALQLTVQVTQRAVDAYREISRMQV